MPELFGMPYLFPAIVVVVLLVALIMVLVVNRRKQTGKPPKEMTHVEKETEPAASDPFGRFASPYPPLESSVPDVYGAVETNEAGATSAAVAATAGEVTGEPETTSAAAGIWAWSEDDEPAGTEAWAEEGEPAGTEAWAEEGEPAGTEPALITGAAEGAEAEENGGQVVADDGDTEPQPPVVPSNGRPIRPGPEATASSEQGFGADPITPILTELLHGWGEFSSADMKRLSLFRPEKVQAALGALEIPKDLTNDQNARGRLEQLAVYASQLQAGTTVESALADAADEEGAGAPGAGPIAGATALAAVVATDEAEATDAEPPALIGPSETPLSTLPWALEAHQWERAEVEPDVAELRPYEEWPLTVSTQTGSSKLGSELWEERPAPGTAEDFQAIEAGALAAFAAGSVSASGHDPMDDTIETIPRPAPLLGGIVKTADDLMALPPEERGEMVAFLAPAELAGVLKRTDDSELKRAIIDTLEHVSTPASLDVLRECLEDRDPEIQMYALQAADRILGH